MKRYIPNPIDTGDIDIDGSLLDLLEKLARNTHEVWSQGRIDEGWVYGKKRDDDQKQHSCLVPYDQLPESEKDYDRQTALETIKLILKLGYKITPPGELILDSSDEHQNKALLKKLNNKTLALSDLVILWDSRNSTLWRANPELYLQLGISFLKCGEALLAYDVFSEAITFYPDFDSIPKKHTDIYISTFQQQALALAETGATGEAACLLNNLDEKSHQMNAETYGLLGRTYKEMALTEDINDESRAEYLEKSFHYYFSAYEDALKNHNYDGAYYNGINAATVSLFMGDKENSQFIAKNIIQICQQIISNQKDVMYWVYATLGEAELLVGDIKSAKENYSFAVEEIGDDIRGQISMYKQAGKILEYLKIVDDAFHQIFRLPTVLVFSGHMVDHPASSSERFPASSEEFVRQEIRNKLKDYKTCIAYSSAACGADIIFLEEVLAKGGEINVILPFDVETFKSQSVDIVPESDWLTRFDKLLTSASRVITLTQFNPDVSTAAHDYTNRFIYGLALTRSNIISCEIDFLSVWDGISSNKPGSTSSAIQLWLNNANIVSCIHPEKGLSLIENNITGMQASIISETLDPNNFEVKYYNYLPLLFADVKGYSKLDEKQLVAFSTVFLGLVNRIFKTYNEGILSRRTQGDGLFVVFNSIHTAAYFAHELNTVVSTTNWEEHGLPDDLAIRVSLDAGPCYSYIEPITGNLEFCGEYVNRAARIEPITPPGHVYASETFVALSNVEKIQDYQFVYSGQVVLPKGYGIIPAYNMRKKRGQSYGLYDGKDLHGGR